MNKFILLILLLSSVSASAKIRHVGNGGGEAEMKVLRYFEFMPFWLEFCKENSNLCVQNENEMQSVQKSFANLKIDSLMFVNQKDYVSALYKDERGSSLVITHESLYVNDKTPKADLEIFSTMLSQILKTDSKVQIEAAQVNMLADGYQHANGYTYFITSKDRDYLFSGFENINAQLETEYGITNYKIISQTLHGYYLTDLVENVNYEVSFFVVKNQLKMNLMLLDSY